MTRSATSLAPTPTIFEHEFSLKDRVALVSGANRGLGLEMSMALAEAGARAVYCVDLPKEPSDEWCKVKDYLARMKGKAGEGRLEYLSADVRDQVSRISCLQRSCQTELLSYRCRNTCGRSARRSATGRVDWM